MKRAVILALLALTAGPAWADPPAPAPMPTPVVPTPVVPPAPPAPQPAGPPVKVPERIEIKPGGRYKLAFNLPVGVECRVDPGFDENEAGLSCDRLYSKKNETYDLRIVADPEAVPGKYQYQFTLYPGTAEDTPVRIQVVVVGKKPTPTPDPSPTPTPTPDTSPAPFAANGFSVLIVYDPTVNLPLAQHSILYGETVRGYLSSKCVLGPDKRTPEARMYAVGTDVSAESKVWQDAMKVKTDKLPWIVISTGKTGFSGPLPATVDDTMKLLQKYAEGK